MMNNKILDISKMSNVNIAEMSDQYENEYIALLKERNILAIQFSKYQKIVQDIADKHIDAIPAEYLTEVKNNVTDNK